MQNPLGQSTQKCWWLETGACAACVYLIYLPRCVYLIQTPLRYYNAIGYNFKALLKAADLLRDALSH